MKINSTVKAIKSVRGKILGYAAHFASLGTAKQHDTKQLAEDDLMLMIANRCDYRSTDVQVLVLRGHVGIFTYGLFGDVETRHLFPSENRVSLSSGCKSMSEAKDSFRSHVAQLTWKEWDLESDTSAILDGEAQREFTSWARFQLAYRHAHEILNMSDTDSHLWACNPQNYAQLA